MDQSLPHVLVGLSAGIVLVGIVASVSQSQSAVPFGPLDTQRPRNQFGDAAIRIALQNDTLKEEFKGSELRIVTYRDWGVSHRYYDCPMNGCAIIIFADKSDPTRSVSVLVNMNSKKVVEIRAGSDLLISKVSETEEAKLFLSRYTDLKSSVDVGPGYSVVKFEAGNVTRFLTLTVRTNPIGDPIGMYVECLRDGKIFATHAVQEFIRGSDCLS